MKKISRLNLLQTQEALKESMLDVNETAIKDVILDMANNTEQVGGWLKAHGSAEWSKGGGYV